MVVVALDAVAAGPATPLAGEDRPDALVGISQVLSGLFTDQLVADVQTLATVNRLLGAGDEHATAPAPAPALTGASPPAGAARSVPYIVIAPQERNAIAQRALEVVRALDANLGRVIRHRDIAALARVVDGDADVRHADLLSLLLFTPEFTRELIALGEDDARRWLRTAHDLDDLWQVGPLPAG